LVALFRAVLGTGREAVNAWNEVYATSMGAALAYYTVFSLTPLVVLVLALGGLFVDSQALRARILHELSSLIGSAGANAVGALLGSDAMRRRSLLAALVGAITLLIGATSVFAELQTDLDRIWQVPPAVQPSGVWGILRTRLLSFGLIIALGFLLVVSLALTALLGVIGGPDGAKVAPLLLRVLNAVVSYAGVAVVFLLVYKLLPSVRIRWRDALVGALITTSLFTFGKYLIGLYVGNTQFVSGYGAAGSVMVLFAWVYYSALIFLFGAIATRLYAQARRRQSISRESSQ